MTYKINARILSAAPGKKTEQSWALYDMKSVGVWEGEEFTDAAGSEGKIINVATKFVALEKAHPKKKKPLTFSWSPTARDERVLFNSILRNRSFEMIVGITDENYNHWRLEFRDIKLMKAPLKKNSVERIEATFTEFRKHE